MYLITLTHYRYHPKLINSTSHIYYHIISNKTKYKTSSPKNFKLLYVYMYSITKSKPLHVYFNMSLT